MRTYCFLELSFSRFSHSFAIPNRFQSQFEFHIHADIRKKYNVEEELFASSGNVVFPNFRAARELAAKINAARGVVGNAEKEMRAGHLNAMGLIDEINHVLVRLYEEQENPGVMTRAYQHLVSAIGKERTEDTLEQFLTAFPPVAVYRDQLTIGEYFERSTEGRINKEIALEEMTMLFLANFNPAFFPFKEMFDDTRLAQTTSYLAIITELEKFFSNEKPFGPDNEFLFDVLKKPVLANPNSLDAQLGFIKERYGLIISQKFLDKISGSFELSKEEERYIWEKLHGGGGGMPNVETFVPVYKRQPTLTPEERLRLERLKHVRPEDYVYDEPENFTQDTDWMPNVVLIAKNIYVWLDQLSKKYQREIKRLEQIPDEELDQLARWNFNGLWLIGVWERSLSSKKIKQINGNLDAVSSAYSLFDYEIARDLGGEEAFQQLNRRAWQRGIRLAGDMVPNHMGLFSKWVIEHPEYFIQSDHPPYPSYRFTGPNLSDDPNIELRIEDGYWGKNDAAVVFQRIDRRNGDTRYIYHGNDGTSMPWNDTAQLNLLRTDVREAIIQNIFHVARKFSIIRFDAAMTLAKKHYQRLWYPMPGTSGVPSRQDFGLTRAEFDELFPNEFWREVVDRFNGEMPQTLLLAEAFWLMEGYFVRTLGMHRVYNSAFMHMLMKEENGKFRSLIKNTLEFNPEILKRYVNFMSNPDEQTAIAQFGKDDKYFGVATVMVTLPGLPMFAHGQIEGFTEKYGMEYQRAYYNETPDEWLMRRHEYEIFPLTKKRNLFSHVHNFEFYDFHDERGFVNENVFVYSNRAGSERAIIFFHNKFAECRGWIKHSVPKAVTEGESSRSVTLGEGLQLDASEKIYYRFRERKSHHEYVVSGKDLMERGFRIELRAFQYAMFMDFQEIYDETGEYELVSRQLNGNGVVSLETVMQELKLKPLHEAIRKAVDLFDPVKIDHFVNAYENIFQEVATYSNTPINSSEIKEQFADYFVRTEKYFTTLQPEKTTVGMKKVQLAHWQNLSFSLFFSSLYRLVYDLEDVSCGADGIRSSEHVFQQFHLDELLSDIFVANERDHFTALNDLALLKALIRHRSYLTAAEFSDSGIVDQLFNDFETADFLNVNQHNDVWYFNREQYETLIHWIMALRFIFSSAHVKTDNPYSKAWSRNREMIGALISASKTTGYQVEKLKEAVSSLPKAEKITSKKFPSKRKQQGKTKKVAPVKKKPI